jgi:hypothetical protein
VDANEGSVACGGAASFNEVSDKVVDGHDDGGVVDFGDGGRAAADVDDLLNELFSGLSEVALDRFGDWLGVKWQDQEDGHGIDGMDFVTVATNEGVLFQEFLERGREGDPKDPTRLGYHGRMLCGQFLVHL